MEKFRAICPLINFKLQWNYLKNKGELSSDDVQVIFAKRRRQIAEGIELVDGIKLRFFTKQDIRCFNNALYIPLMDFKGLISTRSFLLEKIVVRDQKQKEVSNKIRKIILALRLFREGDFFGDDVICFDTENEHNLYWSREGNAPSSDFFGIGYGLNFEDFPEFTTLLNKIYKIDFEKRKSLHLACTRFQRAYQEVHYEDKLIDYMIAFEALFLKGEKQTRAKGATIAIACSVLLGNNEKEREEIKKTINTAYSLRNNIVHGATSTNVLNLLSILEEIDGHLRASIIKFLD